MSRILTMSRAGREALARSNPKSRNGFSDHVDAATETRASGGSAHV
jgi:hypothetical protein